MEAERTAFIADVHLGYGWAQRRRGELGPLADERSRQKLLALREELQPKRIIFLGDLVHAPRPCEPERAWIEQVLQDLSRSAELIAVRGNHDRGFAEEFGHLSVETVPVWHEDSITAIHGDRLSSSIPDDGTLLLGHLHPALPVHDTSGAGCKLPVFLASPSCIVLPAFSPFAGGYNVACGVPEELAVLFREEEIEAIAVTGTRAARLGSLYQVLERMFAADTGNASRFRGSGMSGISRNRRP
jgi:hypothetical protein